MSKHKEKTIDDNYNENISNIDDKDIVLSVALSERYKKEKRKAFKNNSRADNIDESILFNCDPYQKITGIETDMDCDFSSVSEIEDSISNVSKIRFELDNYTYTQWYEWHPDHKEHQLTCLIDYYGDGDISNMLNTDVLTVGVDDEVFHIAYPTPYNTYSSHILFENVYEPLYRMSGNKLYAATSLKGDKNPSSVDVSPDITMNNFLSNNTTKILGTALNIIGIISSIGIGIMTGLTGAFSFLLSYLLLFVVIGLAFKNVFGFHYRLIYGSVFLLHKFLNFNKVDRISD